MKTKTIQDYIKSKYPFESFLQTIYGSKTKWALTCTEEELVKHGNVFSKILLECIDNLKPKKPRKENFVTTGYFKGTGSRNRRK